LHALEKTLLGNPQTPETSDLVRANFEHTLGFVLTLNTPRNEHPSHALVRKPPYETK